MLAVAGCIYFAFLFPVSNFPFEIGATMGERLVYHASLGFAIAAAWGLVAAIRNRAAIVGVLDDLRAALGEMRDLVAAGDRAGLLDRLDTARAARVNLPARFRTAADLREVRIPVPDRPGVVADVAILAADLDVNIVDLEIAHSTEGPQGVLVMLIETGSVDVFRAGLLERGYRPAVRPVDPTA